MLPYLTVASTCAEVNASAEHGGVTINTLPEDSVYQSYTPSLSQLDQPLCHTYSAATRLTWLVDIPHTKQTADNQLAEKLQAY